MASPPLSDKRVSATRLPTPKLIANLLTDAGFEVERTEVVTDAWPPRYPFRLHELLPSSLFRAASYLSAVLLRRRQLHVVARRS
jgi:hypothetical protein